VRRDRNKLADCRRRAIGAPVVVVVVVVVVVAAVAAAGGTTARVAAFFAWPLSAPGAVKPAGSPRPTRGMIIVRTQHRLIESEPPARVLARSVGRIVVANFAAGRAPSGRIKWAISHGGARHQKTTSAPTFVRGARTNELAVARLRARSRASS
jgi:hypothetical protein